MNTLLRRSQYIWLFQAPLLPELQMAANDYKALEDVFLGNTFGVRNKGARWGLAPALLAVAACRHSDWRSCLRLQA